MKNQKPLSLNIDPVDRERRRAPRLTVATELTGVSETGVEIRVINASVGGLMVHSASPFDVGAQLRFSFPIRPDRTLCIAAQVAHSLRATASCNATYVTGLRFVHANEADTSAVTELLQSCKAGSRRPTRQPTSD